MYKLRGCCQQQHAKSQCWVGSPVGRLHSMRQSFGSALIAAFMDSGAVLAAPWADHASLNKAASCSWKCVQHRPDPLSLSQTPPTCSGAGAATESLADCRREDAALAISGLITFGMSYIEPEGLGLRTQTFVPRHLRRRRVAQRQPKATMPHCNGSLARQQADPRQISQYDRQGIACSTRRTACRKCECL